MSSYAPKSAAPSLPEACAALGRPYEARTTARGTINAWRPAPRILVTHVRGHFDMPLARVMDSAVQRVAIDDGEIFGFHDWEQMTDYDSDVRVMLTNTSVRLLSSVRTTHFLTANRLVAFGVRTADVILRRLVIHEQRAPFEAELRSALKKRR